jgi:hypothetical protein
MWVTLPHRAVTHSLVNEPADYALRLCILVKTGVDMREVDLTTMFDKLGQMRREDFIAAGGAATCEPLNPKLKLYVEYSNETWNGGFKQAHYCCDEGLAAGLDTNRWTAGFKFHAWAGIRVFRAADLVFGKDSPRVVKVLATQSANPWIAERHVEVLRDSKHNPWGTRANAMATAPYFGHSVAGDAPDVSEKLRAGIQSSAQQSARHKKIADAAGLKLIAYEGGQHVTKAARKINLDPAMYGLYMEYLNEMCKYFSHFCHYAHVGRAGDGGAWGAIEHTGQPLEQVHKYRALSEWSAKNH